MPALDLGEASLAENLQVAFIQIPTHVEVGVFLRGTCICIRLGSLAVRGSLSGRLGSYSLLSLLSRGKHQRVLFAAPDSEAGSRTWLHNTISLSDLILWAVNQLKDQVGHIAVEPSVGERQGGAACPAPVDQLSELALAGHDCVKVDTLSIRNKVCLRVEHELVSVDELVVALVKPSRRHLHHLLRKIAHDKHRALLLTQERLGYDLRANARATADFKDTRPRLLAPGHQERCHATLEKKQLDLAVALGEAVPKVSFRHMIVCHIYL